MHTMDKQAAIELFGSHIKVALDGSSITQELGSYEDYAKNSGYGLNPGQIGNDEEFYAWMFHDSENGRKLAAMYAKSRRIEMRTRAQNEIDRREYAAVTKTVKIKALFSNEFKDKVATFNAETAEIIEKADATEAKKPEIKNLPEQIKFDGDVLPLQTSIFQLSTDMNRGHEGDGNIIEIKEYTVFKYVVYSACQTKENDYSVQMYYNSVELTAAQKRGQVDGYISPGDITGDEIKTNVIGQRMFTSREAAIDSGKAYAKSIIASLQKFV